MSFERSKVPIFLHNKAYYLLLLSFAYVIYSHWQSLNGGFLSDTYSIYIYCYNLDEKGELWSTIFSQFWHGMINGGIDVYRPLGYLSICGEFHLFGNSPFVLRSMQLAFHLLNALMLFVLMKTIFKANKNADITAVFVAVFFLFSPVSPEISMWIATRHDSLALFFMLLAVLFHWQNKKVFGLISMVLAYSSKESAIVLPAMLFSVSYFKTPFIFKNFKNKFILALKETWTYWLVFLIYLLARFYMFGGAFHVYEARSASFGSFVHNLSVFPRVFSQLTLAAWSKSSLVPWFWTVFLFLVIYSYWVSYKNKKTHLWVMFFSWILITLLALVTQVGSTDSSGAGSRILYTLSAWCAVLVSLPLLFMNRKTLSVALGYSVLLIYIQALPLQNWTQAAVVSKKLLSSVKKLPPLENNKQWSLVLTPDHIGVGLLARTAQGGFSLPPFRSRYMLDEMVPFVETDLEIWRLRLVNKFMLEFKKNSKKPNQYPAHYYCTQKDGNLIEMQIEEIDASSKEKWQKKWKQQTDKLGCYF